MPNLGEKPTDLWIISLIFLWNMIDNFPLSFQKESISLHKCPLWIYAGLSTASRWWNLQSETWRGLVLNQRRGLPPDKSAYSTPLCYPLPWKLPVAGGYSLAKKHKGRKQGTRMWNKTIPCMTPRNTHIHRCEGFSVQKPKRKKVGRGGRTKEGKISFSKTTVKLFFWMSHNIIAAR